MKHSLLTLCLFTSAIATSAQTQPVPQTLPYLQNFDSFSNAAGVAYPDGIQGWRVSTSVPSSAGRTNVPSADVALTAAGSAASSNSGIYDFNGKIGIFSNGANDYAFAVALNTMSVPTTKRVSVTFDAMIMRNLYDNGVTNDYINGLVFQYRVGTTSTFTTINNTFLNNGTAPGNISGTTGVGGKTFNFTLPEDASNQSIVQIRWIMRVISGTAPAGTNRPSFAVDNIKAEGITVLPVKLMGFKGEQRPEGIKLNWTTASEVNNNRFEILRSVNGEVFETIGSVNGIGNTNSIQNYAFTDEEPFSGLIYYQLKQIDNDGAMVLSDIIPVNSDLRKEEISVYVTKDNSQVMVQMTANAAEQAVIKLFDLSGHSLANLTVLLKKGSNSFKIPTQNLNSDLNILTLTRNGKSISKKFVSKTF